MNILVSLGQASPELAPAQQELLAWAQKITTTQTSTVTALLTGPAEDAVLDQLGAYGVTTVLHNQQNELKDHGAAAQAEALVAAAKTSQAQVILLENSSAGKDAAAQVAAALDAGVASDIVSIDIGDSGRITAEKTVLAGTYTVQLAVTSASAVLTIKSNTIDAAPGGSPQRPELVAFNEVDFSPTALAVRVLERTPRNTGGRPALTDARIVVSGGRGTQGDFAPIEQLADTLGAAIGATRVATDEGWIDHSAQVGQTGVTVAPQLYISAGISGAIQQKSGMQTSRVIVAVNDDPDAPVFEIADFGIVGDLFQVLPQAAAEIQRRRNES